MADANVQPNRQLRAPARADFRAGRYLRAADLQLEQAYRLERARRHNRLLHEWGIVCGLWVAAAAEPARPWALYVCPGFAIGPYGDEIEVRERTLVNVRDFLWAKPPEGKLELRRAFVAIRYRELPRRLAALPSTPCACDHPEYAASRVADGFELAALWTPPKVRVPQGICERTARLCPECPESGWIVLARVLLPAAASQLITQADIDNGVRSALSNSTSGSFIAERE